MKFWKRLTKQSKELNYYDSIDKLPIKIWFDVHSSGDYSLLLIDPKDLEDEELINLEDVWQNIYNQYIKMFGLSEDYIDYLDSKKELALMKCEMILDKSKKYLKTMIKIEEEKLKGEKKKKKDSAILNKTIAKISKYYGFHLKSSELTVSEYYSYIENIKDGR